MVMAYWSVAILFWQLSIDHIVSVIYKRWGLAKTRLRHPSLPFDSLPYPTHTICRRVRTYVRSVNQPRYKLRETCKWYRNSVGNSNRENGPTFLDFPVFLGIFQWDEPTKRVPFTTEPEIPEILTNWKAPQVTRLFCEPTLGHNLFTNQRNVEISVICYFLSHDVKYMK